MSYIPKVTPKMLERARALAETRIDELVDELNDKDAEHGDAEIETYHQEFARLNGVINAIDYITGEITIDELI
jgi:hypothetical protein